MSGSNNKRKHSLSHSWITADLPKVLASLVVVVLLFVALERLLLIITEPLDGFDVPTDHLPEGETDSLLLIPRMENVQENVLPPSLVQRKKWETSAQKRLRFHGNGALIQYGDRLRNLIMFGGEFLSFQQVNRPSQDEPRAKLFRERLHDLAPWLNGDHNKPGWPMYQFPQVKKPDSIAIVICAGENQMSYLVALLHTIRIIHHSKIPVYISYRGDPDLSAKSRQNLSEKYSQVGGLNFLDLTQWFSVDAAKLYSWNLKIFGLLLIPEAQVAIMDVDVMLVRPPEDLFLIEGFQKEGALFFHDRSVGEGTWTPRQVLLRLQPHPSATARLVLTNGDRFNEHVQESGVVLIDKTHRYRGLWATCLLLGRWDTRRFVQHDFVYGDKELYWIAFETINEPYAFSRYYPGVIGSILTDFNGVDRTVERVNSKEMANINSDPNMALCGRLLHFDAFGTPLWSNGGYRTAEDDRGISKNSQSQKGLRPLLFVDGGDWQTERGPVGLPGLNQYWKYHKDMGVSCIYPNARGIRQVPELLAAKATEAVSHYLQQIALA